MLSEGVEKRNLWANIAIIILTLIFLLACGCFCIIGSYYTKSADALSENADGEDIVTVIIDAGHGGEDGGAVGVNGVAEKEINLSVALLIRDMLASEGYRVIMTRESDILLYDPSSDYKGHKKQQDLAKRLEIARENEGAIFVSIHMNSFTESKYSGMQVYYSANNPTSRKLAERIREYNVRDIQPYNTRQIKAAGSNIYLLHRMNNPSVLVECGFLSNPAECQRLCDSEYQRSIAFSIFSAIKDSLPEIYAK